MLRRLFTVLSAASLVLCVATCVLWAATHRTTLAVGLLEPGERWRVASYDGRVWVDNQPQVDTDRDERERLLEAFKALEWQSRARDELDERDDGRTLPQRKSAAAAAYRAARRRATSPSTRQSVRHVAVAGCASILPALWVAAAVVRRVRRGRRRASGRCLACGYDLTGNASGACPECGARVRASSPAAGSGSA
ncbi:MAG: hypothetical protein JWO31_599 [Phycisphaerales bacterium]|nr:hypothetical protein [Phycisphaerales bacterium]